jgi:protein disulfide-isomerase A4
MLHVTTLNALLCAVPVWESLASELHGKQGVVIAQIDMTKNLVRASGVNIQGYPSIYLFKRGQKRWPIEYQGNRDVASFAAFLEKHATR